MNNELTVQESSLPIQDFEAAGKFLTDLKAFLNENMQSGVDYGIIPGTGNKPTLLKPGAEKLLNFFNYSSELTVEEKVEDSDKPFYMYKYKCEIFNKDGRSMSTGFGSSNSKETKYTRNAKQTVYDQINTIDKMAQKRAFVHATLIATRASEFYTQDVEDMPEGSLANSGGQQAASAPRSNGYPPQPDFDAVQAVIDATVTEEDVPALEAALKGMDGKALSDKQKGLLRSRGVARIGKIRSDAAMPDSQENVKDAEFEPVVNAEDIGDEEFNETLL